MAGGRSLADRLHERIAADGPMLVSDWIEAALYDPADGFYMSGGRAGRRGDFITAPEVGPLFGAVISRAVDSWWEDAGRPEHFPVYEMGAGPGTLARSVMRASPAAAEAGALAWWAVEISAEQRSRHPDCEWVHSVGNPGDAFAAESGGRHAGAAGVVIANELLDNIPFDIAELTSDGWCLLRVASEPSGGGFSVSPGPPDFSVDEVMSRLAPTASVGDRLPWQHLAGRWVAEMAAALPGSRVIVFDYGGHTEELLARSPRWLRTHVEHSGSAPWLTDPGHHDITADIDLDQLQLALPIGRAMSQAQFLSDHGIHELVEEGRRIWAERAHIGDLKALAARSRVREAEALCDPMGMGSFHVVEWRS